MQLPERKGLALGGTTVERELTADLIRSMKKLRCPTIGRHAPLDRANGLLEARTSGVEPESPHKRTVVVITLLYQLSYWPPMNGSQVGLEPTTHGLSGNLCVAV